MAELSLEQIKAKEQEQAKLAIIEPIIKGFSLGKREAYALASLDAKVLKKLVAKVDEAKHTRRYQSKIVDPKRPASLLWAIAKSACSPNEKVIQDKMYTVRVSGVQVLSCFAVSAQLYRLAEEKETEEKGVKKV